MSEQQLIQDEVGQARGPQAAAKEALGAEVAGVEGDGRAGDQAQDPGAPPPDPNVEWEELLTTGFGALFGLLALRWPSMKASEKEIAVLAKAWAPVAVKHAQGTVPIEVVAAAATVAVLAPKLNGAMDDERVRRARRVEAEQAARTRDPGTVHP